MGTKKILFFACLWLVTIGNAQVIRGYDYCHDTLAHRINIRKVARYVKIWKKYWYQTTTYFFRNDSIIADKTYKSDLHYQKKKWASTHKAYNIKMAYKPTLEVAEDFVTIKEHKIKHYYRRIFIKQIV